MQSPKSTRQRRNLSRKGARDKSAVPDSENRHIINEIVHLVGISTRLLRAADLEDHDCAPLKELIVRPKMDKKWRQYADDEWFKERESVCETVLARYLVRDFRSKLPPYDR